MATQHTIFNLAAGLCGEPPLQNVDEASEVGRQLRAFWDGTVATCMEAYPWNFLEVRTQLSRAAAAPKWGYDYYYPLPADCEKVVRVSTTGEEEEDFYNWREEQGKIASSAETIYLLYTSSERKTQSGHWTETFAEWVAAELALKIAPKLALSSKDLERLMDERKRLRREARSIDAANNPPRRQPMGSWARAARSHGRHRSEHGR